MNKGIILAGGSGTRLSPFTKVTNKHLLPLGTRCMIDWPIWLLKSAGIDDIMVITGKEHAGAIINYLGSGFTYKVQEKADGIAGAIRLAKDFTNDEEFTVVLGDNIVVDGSQHMECDKAAIMMGLGNSIGYSVCKVFMKSVDNPKSFGVGRFENGKLVEVIEKPKDPPSDKALMGVYQFNQAIFGTIDSLEPSERGELEITHAIDYHLKNDPDLVEWIDFGGLWLDTGEIESYHKANQMIANATPNY